MTAERQTDRTVCCYPVKISFQIHVVMWELDLCMELAPKLFQTFAAIQTDWWRISGSTIPSCTLSGDERNCSSRI